MNIPLEELISIFSQYHLDKGYVISTLVSRLLGREVLVDDVIIRDDADGGQIIEFKIETTGLFVMGDASYRSIIFTGDINETILNPLLPIIEKEFQS